MLTRMKVITWAVSLGLVLILILLLLPGCVGELGLPLEERILAAQGGSIGTSDGKITVEIPPGALAEDTTVSISVLSEDEWTEDVRDLNPVGPVYSLEPDGLNFQEPVTVKLALDSSLYFIGANKTEITAPLLFSIDSNSQPELLQDMETVVSPDELYVRGNTTHFSPVFISRGTVKVNIEPGEVKFKECDVYFKPIVTIINVGEKGLPHTGEWGKGKIPTNITDISLVGLAAAPVTQQKPVAHFISALSSDNSTQVALYYFITEGKGKYGASIRYNAAPVDKPEFKNRSTIRLWCSATAGCLDDKEKQTSITSQPIESLPLYELPKIPYPRYDDLKVIFTYPKDGQINVPVDIEVFDIWFSEPMDWKTGVESISISPSLRGLPKFPFTHYWILQDSIVERLIIRPSYLLDYSTTYTVTISTVATSLADKHLKESYTFRFTTEEEPKLGLPPGPSPKITSIYPPNGAKNVSELTDIIVIFSNPMSTESVDNAFIITPWIARKFVWSNDFTKMNVNPASLDYGVTYTVQIFPSAKDIADQSIKQTYTFSFTIRNKPTSEPPKVSHFLPSHRDEGVPLDTAIKVAFSKPMDKASVVSAFSITPPVEGEFEWSDNTIAFYPVAPLEYGITYTVTISTEAKDLDGNNLAEAYSWEFTTKEPKE